jgi:chaperonin GroES
VSRLAIEEKTAGGLYLPGADEKKSSEGIVAAVGPGAVTESGANVMMNVKVGDKVLLPEYGGMKIELDGEEKFLYRESDILGKFE